MGGVMRCFFGLLTVLLLGLCFSSLSAQNVAEQELQQARPVDFVNYQGQFTTIVMPEEFRQIGIGLARMTTTLNTRYTSRNQYSIIRAHDARETKGFDADIFMLEGASDLVDIRGVRALIAGYVEGQYGYSARDSQTIALFVTYYNALYRGRMDYMRTYYKPVVTNHLVPDRIGLALNYRDWPGRTQMLIPLGALMAGEKPALDADQLATQDVIDSLRERPDMGIQEREELLEIRKDDVDKKQEELETKKEQLEETKKALEETTQEVKAKEDAIDQKKEELQKETDPVKQEELKQEIAKDEKGLEELKKELEQSEEQVKKEEAKIEEAKDQLEQKKEEIKKEEEQIKKDEATLKGETPKEEKKEETKKEETKQEETKKEETKKEELQEALAKQKEELERSVTDGGLYYLKVIEPLNDGHYRSEMVLINPELRQVVLNSPFKDVCGSSYYAFSEGVVVIGYDKTHTGGHFLVLLHTKTLAPITKGKDLIYWKSFIEVRQDSVYAIIQDGTGYYLGRFNAKLEPEARSAVKIDRDSFITIVGQSIYMNSPNKTILVFNAQNLALTDEIKP